MRLRGFFYFDIIPDCLKPLVHFFLGGFVMVCIYLKICVLGKNYRNLSKTIGIFQTIHQKVMMHTSAEADFLTQCSPQQWVSLTQNLGSALVCIMGIQRLERGQKCLETINLLQSKFAAEPFAVKLLNDIILQNHNPSCISGVIIHLQMIHNGVDLVVESDFLPYSKGFYIIYLHIYIYGIQSMSYLIFPSY